MTTIVELRKEWEKTIDELLSLPFRTPEFRKQQDLVSEAWKRFEQASQQAQAQYESALRMGKAL